MIQRFSDLAVLGGAEAQYFVRWHAGKTAPDQSEGYTWVTSQVREQA